MKHLKKLSVVLMMTTLLSASFTSCIDTEVSPVVEAIYEAQADLIAAQTAVQNAEAALRNAQANAAQAQADYTDAQTAQVEALTDGIVADNAHQEALREQELRLLVAQTDLGVTEAENALAIAEEAFKIEMAELMAELEEAGVQLAIDYAYKYRNAMYAANNILSEKLQADEDLADAQLMLVDAEDMTYEYHLAQLQNEVTMYEAQVAYITDWLALLNADATDPLAVMETLKVQIADLEAQEDAIDILAQEQYNKVMAIYDQADNRDDALYRIMDSLEEHNDAVEEKNDREDDIETAEGLIEDYQEAIDNYDATTTELEGYVTDALGDVTTAAEALGTVITATIVADFPDTSGDSSPIDPAETLYELLWNAQLAQAKAQAKVDYYETTITGLYGTYQAAIADYASEQAIYDSGIAGMTLAVTNAQTAVTTAEGNLTIALNDYLAKKTAFELDPTGFVWTAGADGVLGIQTSNTGANEDSYIAVTVVAGASNDTYSAVSTVLPAGQDVGALHISNTYAMFADDGTGLVQADGTTPYVLQTNDFWNVGADDVFAGTNADRLDTAVVVLGNEIEIDPELGDAATGGADAYSVLWDAELALLEAQDDLDNYGVDLAAAKAEFERLRDIYESQVDLLGDAKTELAAATTTTEQGNVDDAVEAFGPSLAALGTPTATSTKRVKGDAVPTDALGFTEVWYNASIDLAIHEDTTAEQYQDMIDEANDDIADWNAEIENIQPIIDAKYAVVAGLFSTLDDLGVEYTFEVDEDGYGSIEVTNFGELSSLYSDLHAAIIAEWQAYWDLELQDEMLEDQQDYLEDLLEEYEDQYENLFEDIEEFESDLATAQDDLEEAKAALALATNDQNAAAAYITYLEAKIANLEVRYANALAIAAQYKALMDAAIAS